MNARRRYIIVVLVVLACAGGGLLWRQFLITEEAKVRTLIADIESAQRRVRSTVPEPAPTPPKESAEANGTSATKLADRLREAAGADSAFTADEMKQWLADANDPAVMRRLATQARNQTRKHYADFFAQLNLPPDQTEALIKLLIDKRQANLDLIVASLHQGGDPTKDPARFGAQVTASKAEIERQIHALIGDEIYAQYQSYDQNFTHAVVLNNLQAALTGGADPLTPEQAARMNQLLEQTSAKHVTEEVVAGAQGFLSPAQMQALQDLRATFLARAQKRLQPGQTLPTEPAAKRKP